MVKKFFNYGAPLSLWFGIQLSLNFSDRFFIEQFYGPQLMGSFAGFSEFIIRVFSIIIFPVTLAIHPKVMNQWNRNQNTHETFRHILNGGLLQIVIFSGVLVSPSLAGLAIVCSLLGQLPGTAAIILPIKSQCVEH